MQYRLVNVLDISQPLLDHSEKKSPSLLKAVALNEEDKMVVLYLEMDGLSFGRGTVFTTNEYPIIKMSQAKIVAKTNYAVDKQMLQELLDNMKAKR
ncbi:hypothetical protein NEHOM01_2066 [Nematocida homosporus]|uniref:uncharacterized protein n=1 Tax=Nematocida homosporus TaxID=1912981 RepID=UPI002220629E|nr:uncharacterized protein NEHOM01_2066 [Nematocida homosporus]KAI5187288.1 hypothetical protein NEHOM01_2066 [Nematocida homosporus]